MSVEAPANPGPGIQRRRATAYATLRATVGFVFLNAGVRKFVQGVGGFVQGMTDRFADTWLPEIAVRLFAYVLPFAEVALGTLLVVGLLSSFALLLTALLLLALTFGISVLGEPPGVARNVTYAAVIFLLVWLLDHNQHSVDGLLRRGADQQARALIL